jgi:hypothetical protein
MGFFSWNTCDGGKSIANSSSPRETFPVWMIAPDGRSYYEPNYEGYGKFGGRPFYELLAELNGAGSNGMDGITIAFNGNPMGDNTKGVVYPKLVERLEDDVAAQWRSLPNPESCEYQGFFYHEWDDFDEDEEE